MSKFICEKCQSSSTCQLYQVSQRDSLSPIKSCYQFKKRKPTNADRIRAMPDEVLAKFIENPYGNPWYRCNECKWESCAECCLEWLKQEATE